MTLMYTDYEQKILELARSLSITNTLGSIQMNRLVFGGTRGSGGGEGGPIQPFIGKIKQTQVTYDEDEFYTVTVPSGEGASLLHNLNKIRAGVAIRPIYNPTNYTVPSGLDSTLIDHLEGIDTTGGWKIANTVVISNTGNGDYTDIATAFATEGASTCYLVDYGVYTCNAQTLPFASTLIGVSREDTILATTGGNSPCLTLNAAGYVSSLTLRGQSTGNQTACVVTGTPSDAATFEHVTFEATSAGAFDTAKAVEVTISGGNLYLNNCSLYGYETFGTAYGLYLDYSVGNTYVVGGLLDGDGGDYVSNAGSAKFSEMPSLQNGTMTLGGSETGAVTLLNDRVQLFDLGLVASPDEITATDAGVAASLTTLNTEVTTNGDSDLDNVTLANGTSGQIKHIYCVVEGNAADTWKITPASMVGGTQITFAGVGQGCTLVYADNEGWCVVANNGGTIS